MLMIEIWTDGSCLGNPGPGGWASFLFCPTIKGKALCGYEVNTTNNRMELTAVVKGLSALKTVSAGKFQVTVFTDSAYIVNCMQKKWYVKWKANNWKKGDKKPVANRDLWEALLLELDRVSSYLTVQFKKVEAHVGIEHNEIADELANAQANYAKLKLEEGCVAK